MQTANQLGAQVRVTILPHQALTVARSILGHHLIHAVASLQIPLILIKGAR